MNFLSLLGVELLKTKRSLALLMMFVTPLSVLLLSTMMFLHSNGKVIAEKGWTIFWVSNFGLWGVFMLPLYITLITVLLNQIEHKEGGWRLMLSLPISRMRLFLAKLIQALLYLLCANSILVLLIALTSEILQLAGYNGEPLTSWSLPYTFIIHATFSGLAMLIIQQLLAWRFKNFIIPLATGVIGTFSVLQMASSDYWFVNPWAYILVATNSGDASRSEFAMLLSMMLFVVILTASYFYIRRRDITA